MATSRNFSLKISCHFGKCRQILPDLTEKPYRNRSATGGPEPISTDRSFFGQIRSVHPISADLSRFLGTDGMASKGKTQLSRYLKRKLDLQEVLAEVEHLIKKRTSTELGNKSFCDNVINPHEQNSLDLVLPSTSDEDLHKTIEPKTMIFPSPYHESADNEDEADDDCNMSDINNDNTLKLFHDKDCEPSSYLSVLCLAYKLKYHLLIEAFKDHLKIIQIATNSTTAQVESAAKCSAKYDHFTLDVKKVYGCMVKNCEAILQTGKKGLPIRKQKCGNPYNNTRGACYILILPIQRQFNYFLESGGMKLREETTRCDGTTRGDVQSGDFYREKIYSDVTEECTLAYLCNLMSMELSVSKKKKPPRGPFLDTSIAEFKQLGSSGVQFGELTGNDEVGRGSPRVYPEASTNSKFPLRTIEQHEEDLIAISIVLEKGKAVHGIRGPSPFFALTNFDYVKAQGEIKCLVFFWTEPKYWKEPWHLVLEDLLPKQFYDNFLCLVYGMQVLLQEEVLVK
ncbi:hypothetical protein OUZ56_029562 [Daphnia magna]|uniref:Cc8L18.2-like protein n=1 Tax=Daphnia magna TaxID=35525 RepID=A0ABR0B781_9CRUS|nr:hypothetical protein OUZ56_029562 [Daphnia magna]